MTDRPVIDPLDRRLNAWSPEIADIALKGKVKSHNYVEGSPALVIAPWCDLRREPALDCGIDTQLLLGERVIIFERREGWAWIKSLRDGYVGWTSDDALTAGETEVTHMVCVPRTFSYPAADMKLPAIHNLSMGSAIKSVGRQTVRGTEYVLRENGEALIACHLRPISQFDSDYVAVAEKFVGTPYLWGGTTGLGLDCSGLVQLAMRMCGMNIPRDSDMQFAQMGTLIDPGEHFENLERGDLIFWPGHVAIVEGNGQILHANGYTMDVTSEPLVPAFGRIAQFFSQPSGFLRPGSG